MKIRLPYLIQDRAVADVKDFKPTEVFHWNLDQTRDWDKLDQPEVFLDGPVSSRVAVLDFNEDSGALEVSVPLTQRGETLRYDINERDLDDRQFQAVSTFATVMKTLQMFEAPDVLGRRIRWASPGNQLLVVPHAGQWANAYYERESASLQFFSFEDHAGDIVHSSQSFDIVAHETGHAILDAIAPSLYDTITPESLALHETIADLTALIMATSSRRLSEHLLDQTGGSIAGLNAFTAIAEEFGKARGGEHGDPYLRTLDNDDTMNSVDLTNPHKLSQVLSGALFQVFLWIFDRRKHHVVDGEIDSEPTGKSLYVASQIFRRLALRALDYLPPGEISFADYGRAVWAADQNSNPGSPEYRTQLAEEFVRRHIIDDIGELKSNTPNSQAVAGIDLDALADSDWLAYDFANRHRELLNIPADVGHFHILDRLQVSKVTYRANVGKIQYRELLFKVRWETTEDNPIAGLSSRRGLSFGSTLAFDRDTGTIAGFVTTNPSVTQVDQSTQRTRRICTLLEDGLLDDHVPGAPVMNINDDVLRINAAGRTLHMTSNDDFKLRSPGESS